jgi:hypothetical protein
MEDNKVKALIFSFFFSSFQLRASVLFLFSFFFLYLDLFLLFTAQFSPSLFFLLFLFASHVRSHLLVETPLNDLD